MPNYFKKTLDTTSFDYEILLRTIYGEARSEPDEAQRALCWLILNRVRRNKAKFYHPTYGKTIVGVCLAPYQFDCFETFGTGFPMNEKESLKRIERWLKNVYCGSSPIGEADHYYNPERNEEPPGWINNCTFIKKIGNLKFFKENV